MSLSDADIETAIAGIVDETIRTATRQNLIDARNRTQPTPPNPAQARQADTTSPATISSRLKWGLKKNFIKDDKNLDLESMHGEKLETWKRNFEALMDAAGFTEGGVSFTHKWQLLEQCTTEDSFRKIQSLRLSLPLAEQENIEKLLLVIKDSAPQDTHVWTHRHAFRNRAPKQGELTDDYLLSLRPLADKCQITDMYCVRCKPVALDDYILHQLVLVCPDVELQTEYLKKDTLDIDTVLKIARKYEKIRDAQHLLAGESSEFSLSALQTQCIACGRTGHHDRDPQCPAKNSTCFLCGKIGHFRNSCRENFHDGNPGHFARARGYHSNSRGRAAPDWEYRAPSAQPPHPRDQSRHRDSWSRGNGRGPRGSRGKSGPFYRNFQATLVNSLMTNTRTVEVTAKVLNSSKQIRGIIDTGSDWNAGGREHLAQLGLLYSDLKNPTRDMSSTQAANGDELKCLGYMEVEFSWKDNTLKDKIVFFDKLPNMLFSVNMVTQLKIVTIHAEPKLSVLVPTDKNSEASGKENENILITFSEEHFEENSDTKKAEFESPSDFFMNLLKLPNRDEIIREFADVFSPRDEPMKAAPLHITLKEGAKPTFVKGSFGVPLALKDQLKAELEEQKENGIIRRVKEPTDWCSPIVVVPKKGKDKIRLTVDFRNLNKNILREKFQVQPPLQVVQEIESGSKFFTVADCWKGYHQQKIDEESIPLTTFIAPFNLGRWQYLRAPFGLSNISEVYDREMTENLEGIENLGKVVDDNLIFSKDAVSHVKYVRKFLQRCREKGIRLSEEKFQYMQNRVDFAGFTVSDSGYELSKKIYAALSDYPEPENQTDLRGFLGMANQLAPTHVKLSRVLSPLHELTGSNSDLTWTLEHQKAFEDAKQILTSPEVMTYYTPGMPMRLVTDASCLNGLGFVLLQKQNDSTWKPIQVGSRKLVPAERNYAPIELELQGVVFAVKRACTFLSGAEHYTVVTDHQPLVKILNGRRLDEISNKRMLDMVLRLVDETFTVEWVKGEFNRIADALSRHPVSEPSDADLKLHKDSSMHVKRICALNASDAGLSVRMDKVREAAENDIVYQELCKKVTSGFPSEKRKLDENLRPFWNIRNDLLISDDGFLLYGTRLMIPKSLQAQLLKDLHASHRGVEGTRQRARLIVYWPGMDNAIEQICKQCELCLRDSRSQQREPMKHMPRPERAFQYVSADLFSVDGKSGLVYTDWYSGWFCFQYPMKSTDADHVIPLFRKWFQDTAAPDVFWSDNGPPFNSGKFSDFLKRWGVAQKFSSPYYPQGNNYAELAVKNCKSLVNKYWKGPNTDYDDFAKGLMQVRNTPHASTGVSPAMILYGRPTQDALPAHKSFFSKNWHDQMLEHDRKYAEHREKLEYYYDRGTRSLPALPVGTPVAIQNPKTRKWDRYGVIQEKNEDLRRYVIRLPSGMIVVRNRRVLKQRFTNRTLPPITLDDELDNTENPDVRNENNIENQSVDIPNNPQLDNRNNRARNRRNNQNVPERQSDRIPDRKPIVRFQAGTKK